MRLETVFKNGLRNNLKCSAQRYARSPEVGEQVCQTRGSFVLAETSAAYV